MRGTLGDIDPLNKVTFKRAKSKVQKGPLYCCALLCLSSVRSFLVPLQRWGGGGAGSKGPFKLMGCQYPSAFNAGQEEIILALP